MSHVVLSIQTCQNQAVKFKNRTHFSSPGSFSGSSFAPCFLKESGDRIWNGFWREHKNEKSESVKSASRRGSRWAECSRLTCKTRCRITAAHCAKSDSLPLHAESGEVHKCAYPKILPGETKADTVTYIQRPIFRR